MGPHHERQVYGWIHTPRQVYGVLMGRVGSPHHEWQVYVCRCESGSARGADGAAQAAAVWEIRRRYSDFARLHARLSAYLEGLASSQVPTRRAPDLALRPCVCVCARTRVRSNLGLQLRGRA